VRVRVAVVVVLTVVVLRAARVQWAEMVEQAIHREPTRVEVVAVWVGMVQRQRPLMAERVERVRHILSAELRMWSAVVAAVEATVWVE
jgi:hypothetical protein